MCKCVHGSCTFPKVVSHLYKVLYQMCDICLATHYLFHCCDVVFESTAMCFVIISKPIDPSYHPADANPLSNIETVPVNTGAVVCINPH